MRGVIRLLPMRLRGMLLSYAQRKFFDYLSHVVRTIDGISKKITFNPYCVTRTSVPPKILFGCL